MILAMNAQLNSTLGVKQLSSQGDASADPSIILQLTGVDGFSSIQTGLIRVNSSTNDPLNITINSSLWMWQTPDRDFGNVPIDYPQSIEDYVSWTATSTRTIHGSRHINSQALWVFKSFVLHAIFTISRTTLADLAKPHFRDGRILVLASVIPTLALILASFYGSPITSVDLFNDDTQSDHWVCSMTSGSSAIVALIGIYIGAMLVVTVVYANLGSSAIPQDFNNSRETTTSVVVIFIIIALCASQGATSSSVQSQFLFESGTSLFGVALLLYLQLWTP
eukprot:jgi/Hompol1/3271/HPOL_006439-RA